MREMFQTCYSDAFYSCYQTLQYPVQKCPPINDENGDYSDENFDIIIGKPGSILETWMQNRQCRSTFPWSMC